MRNLDSMREQRRRADGNSTKISDLALLETAMKQASEEHLTTTKRKKPGLNKAYADKLEPLGRNRNTAQADYNARPTNEN
jgi:hypothetical protein